MENSCSVDNCICEHGLSLFIETEKHRILMDAGATDVFMSNAANLGVEIDKTDIAVLSHGHYDHGGGMSAFLKKHPNLPFYVKEDAFSPHFRRSADGFEYNGIDTAMKNHSGIVFTDDICVIDDELTLFSGVKGRRFPARGNLSLYMNRNGEYERDDFSHEQCLAVISGGIKVLLSGCAHNGIVNILDRYSELFGTLPDFVISGFHLMQKNGYTDDDISSINALAEELASAGCIFYTGHCTDKFPYEIMKKTMGDSLRPVSTGQVILLP